MSVVATATERRGGGRAGGEKDYVLRSSSSSSSTSHSAVTAKSSGGAAAPTTAAVSRSGSILRQPRRTSSASSASSASSSSRAPAGRRSSDSSSSSHSSSYASMPGASAIKSSYDRPIYSPPPAAPLMVPPLTTTNPSMIPAPVLDRYYRRAVRYTAVYWYLLVALVLYLSPSDSFRRQESSAAAGALGMASVAMGASVLTRALALLAQNMFVAANGGDAGGTGAGMGISGAALVGLFAQTSSCVMNGAMALYPTPSFVDPVTGMRVFLLRWCEWAPLAFIMAFLTASIDSEETSKSGVQSAMRFALCQGVSTTLGLILPTLTSIPAWYCTLGVAVLLHLTLHPLLVQKTLAVLSVSDPTSVSLRASLSNNEQRKNRILVGGHLIQLLTAAWTLLVVLYIAAWFLQLPLGVNAVLECTADVVSKHLYLNYLIEAHHLIFSNMPKEEDHPAVVVEKKKKKKEKKVKIATSTSSSSKATNAAVPPPRVDEKQQQAQRQWREPQEQQQQNVAIVFARGERAASVLCPADVPRNATLLDAALLARSTRRSIFQRAAREAAKKEKASTRVTFQTTLKDGTVVPFTVEQAGERTLDEIVSMRGAGDALRFEVAVLDEEEKEEDVGDMEDLAF